VIWLSILLGLLAAWNWYLHTSIAGLIDVIGQINENDMRILRVSDSQTKRILALEKITSANSGLRKST